MLKAEYQGNEGFYQGNEGFLQRDSVEHKGYAEAQAYQWGNSRLGYWRIAGSPVLKCSITNERLAAAGYFGILNYYESLHLCG